MKKLMLVASLLLVLSVSAQEGRINDKSKKEHVHKEKPTVDEQMKRFDEYNLTSSQKQKVRTLLEDREKAREKEFNDRVTRKNEFDSKLENILDKKQLEQYKEDREKKSNHGHKRRK